MTRIAVSGNVIQWAWERSGISLEKLEERFPRIRQWMDETHHPTLKQVEKLAKRTHTPLGYFFLTEPPEEKFPIPNFRTVTAKAVYHPSPDLLETVYIMQRRQAWAHEFLIEQGEQRLPFVGSAKISDNFNDVAKNIRIMLGLENGWAAQHPSWTHALQAFRLAIEKIGILVAGNGVVGNNTRRKLSVSEFRGFVLNDEYAPLIFVNAVDYKAAQMFTLAHEVAHVWFGSSAAFDLYRLMSPTNNATELACNRVAAEILIPESELRDFWPFVVEEDDPFQAIARRFRVSILVAARKAVDLELIKMPEFFDFYSDYVRNQDRIKKERKKARGGDYYASQTTRIGRRFGAMVIGATKEGKLLYSDAYSLTGLNGNTFNSFAAKIFGK